MTSKILRPLLEVAHARGVKTSAEEHRMRRSRNEFDGKVTAFNPAYGDTLVTWLNAVTPLALRKAPSFEYYMDTNIPVTTADGMVALVAADHRKYYDRNPDHLINEEEQRHRSAFGGHARDAHEKYGLIPECRACYRLFGSWAELRSHLDEMPKHAIAFEAKEYNEIDPHASHGGWVKCPTCAFQSNCTRVGQHLDRTGHRRYGMIPRWKVDNREYHRSGKDRWEKGEGSSASSLPGYYDPEGTC